MDQTSRLFAGMALRISVCACMLAAPFAHALEPLPQGSTGIASRYPGDAGISADSNVVFADDFESYANASGLTSRWSNAYHSPNLRIATEAANVYAGQKSIEMTVPKQGSEVSNSLEKRLDPKRDVLFLRYYAKYDSGFNVIGSSHSGSTISGSYCCPGVAADGRNKFLASLEPWRDSTGMANPGLLNVYTYHPEQRDVWGDHFFPSGRVIPFDSTPGNFGPEFVARPEISPALGTWHSYEFMVKANTPGQRDGRIAAWIDGKLVADFPNIRVRDVTSLSIDKFTLDLHVQSNTLAVARKWYDNVVAARSYIGPLTPPASGVKPRPPTNVRVQ